MSPKYRPVFPALWDDTFARLTKEAKIIAFYIWSGPPGNSEGLARFPFHYMTGDTGLSEEEAAVALVELEAAGYIHWDEPSNVILDRLALRFLPLRNGVNDSTGEVLPDKRIAGAIRKLEEIPDNPLLRELLALAREHSPDFAIAIVARFPHLDEAPWPDPLKSVHRE